MAIDSAWIAGAAMMTIGSIKTHEIIQENTQFGKNCEVPAHEKLATPAATQLVRPDWRVPNTKWL